jgi:hypothetical protein
MTHINTHLMVREDLEKLTILEHHNHDIDLDLVVKALRRDQVVLIRKVDAARVDGLIHNLANQFGLADTLKLQAGFAAFQGYRHNIGQFFMTVNDRGDYQFIPPHSEGTSRSNIQLASFFCYENSTDGGDSMLLNVDESSAVWPSLREKVRRARLGQRALSRREVLRARGLYQLEMPDDLLKDDDEILEEHKTEIRDLTVLEVLAKLKKTYSRILGRELYVYWDSISNIDHDSLNEFVLLLRRCGLLKEPRGGLDVRKMDSSADRRILHSGVSYAHLFKSKITYKLAPGDLTLHNNLSWTHAANNWSPGSGIRNITASFA